MSKKNLFFLTPSDAEREGFAKQILTPAGIIVLKKWRCYNKFMGKKEVEKMILDAFKRAKAERKR